MVKRVWWLSDNLGTFTHAVPVARDEGDEMPISVDFKPEITNTSPPELVNFREGFPTVDFDELGAFLDDEESANPGDAFWFGDVPSSVHNTSLAFNKKLTVAWDGDRIRCFFRISSDMRRYVIGYIDDGSSTPAAD
ncbi:hypothetical protein [Nocardia brasiliensis]|uniref:hypothetical protein n=1 Tax=Nocardia brasiliensis TaxID=37326 RepID=UPI003D908ACF